MTDMYNNYFKNVLPKLIQYEESFINHIVYLNDYSKGIVRQSIDNNNSICSDSIPSNLILRNSNGTWNLYNLNLLASILKLPNKTHKIKEIRFKHYKHNLHVYNYNWSTKLLNHYFDNLHAFNFIEHSHKGKINKIPVGVQHPFHKGYDNDEILQTVFKFINIIKHQSFYNEHISIDVHKLLCTDHKLSQTTTSPTTTTTTENFTLPPTTTTSPTTTTTQELCDKIITVERTDKNAGWGLNLEFMCEGTQVNVGTSGAPHNTGKPEFKVKTVHKKLPRNVVCPLVVNPSDRLDDTPYGDTFNVTTSQCLSDIVNNLGTALYNANILGVDSIRGGVGAWWEGVALGALGELLNAYDNLVNVSTNIADESTNSNEIQRHRVAFFDMLRRTTALDQADDSTVLQAARDMLNADVVVSQQAQQQAASDNEIDGLTTFVEGGGDIGDVGAQVMSKSEIDQHNLWWESSSETIQVPSPSGKETSFTADMPSHKDVLVVLSEVLYKSTISQANARHSFLHLMSIIIIMIVVIMIIINILSNKK